MGPAIVRDGMFENIQPQQPARPLAVITGASRGIGAEYARALARRGFDLLLVSRDRERVERLARELTARHGVRVAGTLLDLSEPDAAHRLYAAAREQSANVDLLINNAGVGFVGEFVTMPMPRIQAMLRLHVNTIVESIRLFLPGMLERKTGGIINVASTAGLMPLAYLTEYAATKAFLIAFSEALAEEVRSAGVKVQACCPGSTETDFHATAGQKPRNPFQVQTAAQVVAKSLKALEHGPTMVTTNWSGRLTGWLGRLVPRGLLARSAARWIRSSL